MQIYDYHHGNLVQRTQRKQGFKGTLSNKRFTSPQRDLIVDKKNFKQWSTNSVPHENFMAEGSLPLVCRRRPGVVEAYLSIEMFCPILRSFWQSVINWSGSPIVWDNLGVRRVNCAIFQDAHNVGVQDEIVWLVILWLVPLRIDAELEPGCNWTCWSPQWPNFQCHFSNSFWVDGRFWFLPQWMWTHLCL